LIAILLNALSGLLIALFVVTAALRLLETTKQEVGEAVVRAIAGATTVKVMLLELLLVSTNLQLELLVRLMVEYLVRLSIVVMFVLVRWGLWWIHEIGRQTSKQI
jgi:hypothetical protein